jgi:hypothetical protein
MNRQPCWGLPFTRVSTFPSLALILTIAVLALLTRPAGAATANPIIINGDLTQGTGSIPTAWQSHAWIPDGSTFSWDQAAGAGELRIVSGKANDAYWIQHLELAAGWYHFSAQLRTSQVGAQNTGASLALLQDWVSSEELHGTQDWQTVEFYLKVGADGASVDLACRLGGYGNLNKGEVACRAIQATAIDAPPAGASHQYDLAALSAASTPPSPNSKIGYIALALGSIALFLVIAWRVRPSRAPKAPPDKRTSAKPRNPPSPVQPPSRKIELILFLLCMLTFGYFYQASDHNAASRIDLIRALTERGSVWIDYYAGFNTADIVQMNSHIYSNKAPGGALTGVIPWLLVTGLLHLLMDPGPWFWALATYLTTLFSVSLITALLCVLTYRFALLFGANQSRAVALALTLVLATILFPTATQYTAEPLAAFAVFAAFYLLMQSRPDDGLTPALTAGLLAGWSVACDYSTFVLAAIVGIYALWKLRDWPKIALFSAGAGASAVILATYDYLAFGSPLFLSYEAYMLPGSDRFAAQKAGFAGVTYPHLTILWNVLGGAQRGLFFCNPVLLLTLPALYYLWHRPAIRAEFLVIATVIIGFILFNGSYGDSVVYWGGGTATGPRHIISALPFMVLAMVALPKGFNYPFAVLALISLWFMLMATAVEPHLPYEYDNPLRDFLWPAYLRGDLAYNKSTFFDGPPIVGDAVAFNLGKLIGLPGALQLLPLLGVWLAAGWWLLRELDPKLLRQRHWPVIASTAALVAMFLPPVAGAVAFQPDLHRPHGLLGSYFEGLYPNQSPPHIVRIDPHIDFDNVVALGSLPYPSSVLWTGRLYAPQPGLYAFMITADDAGWLTIDGKPVITDPGAVFKSTDAGTINLTAGWHNIEVGHRTIWGGSSMHLFWQPPGSTQALIPDAYLTPPHP